jgi:hypothetical protein
MSHTPTPYRKGLCDGAIVAEKPENPIDARGGDELMRAYGGYVIAESCTPSDAAFIVEACNAHERLKAVLDAGKKVCEDAAPLNPDCPHEGVGIPLETFDALYKALALCEEGGKG